MSPLISGHLDARIAKRALSLQLWDGLLVLERLSLLEVERSSPLRRRPFSWLRRWATFFGGRARTAPGLNPTLAEKVDEMVTLVEDAVDRRMEVAS